MHSNTARPVHNDDEPEPTREIQFEAREQTKKRQKNTLKEINTERKRDVYGLPIGKKNTHRTVFLKNSNYTCNAITRI